MHWQGEKQRAEGGGRASPVVAVMKLEAGSQLNVYLENSNFLCFFYPSEKCLYQMPTPSTDYALGALHISFAHWSQKGSAEAHHIRT